MEPFEPADLEDDSDPFEDVFATSDAVDANRAESALSDARIEYQRIGQLTTSVYPSIIDSIRFRVRRSDFAAARQALASPGLAPASIESAPAVEADAIKETLSATGRLVAFAAFVALLGFLIFVFVKGESPTSHRATEERWGGYSHPENRGPHSK